VSVVVTLWMLWWHCSTALAFVLPATFPPSVYGSYYRYPGRRNKFFIILKISIIIKHFIFIIINLKLLKVSSKIYAWSSFSCCSMVVLTLISSSNTLTYREVFFLGYELSPVLNELLFPSRWKNWNLNAWRAVQCVKQSTSIEMWRQFNMTIWSKK
jgi:hypothetical protein